MVISCFPCQLNKKTFAFFDADLTQPVFYSLFLIYNAPLQCGY